MFCYNCGVEIKQEHKFCFSCGVRQGVNDPAREKRERIVKVKRSDPKRNLTHDISVPEKLKTLNLRDVFYKMEAALKKECSLSEDEFEKKWGKFKKYHYKNYSDNDIYWILVSPPGMVETPRL